MNATKEAGTVAEVVRDFGLPRTRVFALLKAGKLAVARPGGGEVRGRGQVISYASVRGYLFPAAKKKR